MFLRQPIGFVNISSPTSGGAVMANPLDNGGPPTDVNAKMRWVRVNISDILEGMDGLSWEQRGFYCTALFKMYARQDGIPFDDKAGSSVIGCNPRTFRCHRDALLSRGKFYVDAGTLRNSRVEREIADFCREVKRRREAALEREKRRRDAARVNSVQPEFEPNSNRIRTELGSNSTRTDTDFAPNCNQKANRNNVCDATAVVSEKHNDGGNQKPETRNQIISYPDAYASGQEIDNRFAPSEPAANAPPRSEADRLHREAYERGLRVKQGVAKKTSRPVGELDGSRGIELRDGKLTVVNGTLSKLQEEFPGIDFVAVCNKAASKIVRERYPSFDAAMAAIRQYAQYEVEAAAKAPTNGRPSKPQRQSILTGLDPKYRAKVEALRAEKAARDA